MRIEIKNATKKGWIECEIGGVFDALYPSSKTRRGRVQENGRICPTITATEMELRCIEPVAYDEQNQRFLCGTVGTLTTDGSSPKHNSRIVEINMNDSKPKEESDITNALTQTPKDSTLITYRVRKLTPRECWRLMGQADQDFDKAQAVCSNTQLYKQAGNSIVVDVLEQIFKQMF